MTELLTDFSPPIAKVILNRADKRNAITHAMWQGLQRVAGTMAGDASIKVVLLRGAGDAAFSAGADIIEMQQTVSDPARMKVVQQTVLDAQAAWERLPMPTIALVRGACTGGGCGLALACDLRLATPDAFFSVPPRDSVLPTVSPTPNVSTNWSDRRVPKKFSSPRAASAPKKHCASVS